MYNLFMWAAVISVPVSVISMFNNIQLSDRVNTLNDIVTRQHNIDPSVIHKMAGKRLPFVRRTITIKDVKFSDSGKATIYFVDKVIPGTIFNQIGCPSIAKHIKKSFVVDYNTVANNYAVNCNKFKL